MKSKTIICALLTLGLAGGLAATGRAAEKGEKGDQAKLEAKAKISKADAEKTALAKVPNGTVTEGELEDENGKLVWSFDITTPDSKDITEVLVNAKTGEIVSVEKETPEDQAKDAEKEKSGEEKKNKNEKD